MEAKQQSRFVFLTEGEKKEVYWRIASMFALDRFVNWYTLDFFVPVYLFPFLLLPVLSFHFSFVSGFLLSFLVLAVYFSSFFLRFKMTFFLSVLLFVLSRILRIKTLVPVCGFIAFYAFCFCLDREISIGIFIKTLITSVVCLVLFRRMVNFSFDQVV